MTDDSPKVRHIDLYPDEFIAGIAGEFDAQEIGVYWVINLLILSRGGPIPADIAKLSSLMRNTHWRTIKATVDRLVDRGKIDLLQPGENGVKETSWSVQRCLRDLARASQRIVKNRSNGRQGGRPTKENNQLAKPDGYDEKTLTTNYQLPTTRLSEDEGSSEGDALAVDAPCGVAAQNPDRRAPGDYLDDDAAPLAGPVESQPTLAGLNAPQVELPSQSEAPRPARKTRWSGSVPQDWQDEAAAIFPGLNIAMIAVAFEDYWTDRTGAPGLKSNWRRTWSVWVSRDAERQQSRRAQVNAAQPAQRTVVDAMRSFAGDSAEAQARRKQLEI